ncbi:hypothetical protein BBOV_I002490 [Babesia bovis T2Bo]|uniref:Uncharacterized protein n=1 Tax=Babesia bovis TaxID=5865 RepID=A7AWA3_BABBO|nr:hypothetical protein BBOV_I002490 [Babesia bovis T2Bo]EDO05331.1 hypothetical protein BBOV_I002490 [Babesia bovis T2Bo]|eukprot:XP_001608899.1 hypothetical protein [Babesia bovis T2Bo]
MGMLWPNDSNEHCNDIHDIYSDNKSHITHNNDRSSSITTRFDVTGTNESISHEECSNEFTPNVYRQKSSEVYKTGLETHCYEQNRNLEKPTSMARVGNTENYIPYQPVENDDEPCAAYSYPNSGLSLLEEGNTHDLNVMERTDGSMDAQPLAFITQNHEHVGRSSEVELGDNGVSSNVPDQASEIFEAQDFNMDDNTDETSDMDASFSDDGSYSTLEMDRSSSIQSQSSDIPNGEGRTSDSWKSFPAPRPYGGANSLYEPLHDPDNPITIDIPTLTYKGPKIKLYHNSGLLDELTEMENGIREEMAKSMLDIMLANKNFFDIVLKDVQLSLEEERS